MEVKTLKQNKKNMDRKNKILKFINQIFIIMNANIYEYGTDPETGLKRRLIRDTAVVQEEMDSNSKPKAVVHLRLQTYLEVHTRLVLQQSPLTEMTATQLVLVG